MSSRHMRPWSYVNKNNLMPTLWPCTQSSECNSCQACFLCWHISFYLISLFSFYFQKVFSYSDLFFLSLPVLTTVAKFLTTWDVLQTNSWLELPQEMNYISCCSLCQRGKEGMYLEITSKLSAVAILKSVNYLYPKGWTKSLVDYRESALCALYRAGLSTEASQEGRTSVFLSFYPPELVFMKIDSGVVAGTDTVYSRVIQPWIFCFATED